MPVPVSVTHARGVGLQAQGAAELPTAGPFARLAAVQDGVVTANGATTANGDHAASAERQPAAATTQPDSDSADERPAMDDAAAAIETSHLHFTYPGIGAVTAKSC